MFAFDKVTGEQAWSSTLPTVPNAFQLFSGFTIAGENAYRGRADKKVYCFETRTGKRKWHIATDDWVRSAPLVIGDELYAATLGGKLFCVGTQAGQPVVKWENTVSEFPILADLRVHGGTVFFTTGDCYLVGMEPQRGSTIWKTSTFECIADKLGNVIIGDKAGSLMSGHRSLRSTVKRIWGCLLARFKNYNRCNL